MAKNLERAGFELGQGLGQQCVMRMLFEAMLAMTPREIRTRTRHASITVATNFARNLVLPGLSPEIEAEARKVAIAFIADTLRDTSPVSTAKN